MLIYKRRKNIFRNIVSWPTGKVNIFPMLKEVNVNEACFGTNSKIEVGRLINRDFGM